MAEVTLPADCPPSSRVGPAHAGNARHRRPVQGWLRALTCLVVVALADSTQAGDAALSRWADRVSPVFRLVASQAGEDAGVPYSASPGAFAEDPTGFIWIGTDVGLERWDGSRIRTYAARKGDPCALPADYVLALHVDDAGRLWISTFGGGLAYYEPQTDCIRTLSGEATDLIRATVGSFASDPDGGLWLGTTAGLLHLAADLAHVTRLSEDSSDDGHLSHIRIASVMRDRHGGLWVGSDRGLERRVARDGRFAAIALPPGSKVRTLLEASDGRVWVGTVAHGAFVVDPATGSIRAVEGILQRTPVPLIWRTAQAQDGEVWLGTTNAGIIRVDPASLRARALHHQKGVATSLPDDEVVDLMRDRSGQLWVASSSGFGFFHAQGDVRTILTGDELNGVGEGPVKALVRLADGRMAIGVGTRIALIDPQGTGAEPVRFDPLPAPGTLATLATPNGRDLFAATQPYGLVLMDRQSRQARVVPLPGPDSARHMLALQPDAERLWVGGIEGLWLVERRHDRAGAPDRWSATRRFELHDVFELALGPAQTRWAGTVKGLYRVDAALETPIHVPLVSTGGDPIEDPYIKSLLTDRRGRLWIGSNSEGLYVVAPSAVPGEPARVLRHLTSGLPSGAISKLLQDTQGTIWVATDRGIAGIDPQSFAIRRLSRGDGIAVSSFVSGRCADAVCSELMFGGLDGITLLRPGSRLQAPVPPPVVVTRVSVGRAEVPSSRFNVGAGNAVLDIPANANSFAVEFAALDYTDPLHYRYEYRLEGYDPGWVPTGVEARMAMYTNLAPGTYRLRLRGTDGAERWPPQERQLLVKVAAAWYQTMGVHALEAVAGLLSLVLIVQARTVLLRTRQRELEALVEERTQALMRATGERNALIENLAHDLRTPLTALRGYLDRLSLRDVSLSDADRGRFLGIAVRQAERLSRLVHELFELVRLDDPAARLTLETFAPSEVVQDVVQEFASIAAERDIHCELELARGVESEQIVGDISLFQRLVENLVDNAVHHTPPGGRITLRLGADAQGIVLEVADTGHGIAQADLERIFSRYERGDTHGRASGAGLGLAIVHRILELHRGSIAVASQVGEGAHFTVRLPRRGPQDPTAPP